jgi:hypothetical protein
LVRPANAKQRLFKRNFQSRERKRAVVQAQRNSPKRSENSPNAPQRLPETNYRIAIETELLNPEIWPEETHTAHAWMRTSCGKTSFAA